MRTPTEDVIERYLFMLSRDVFRVESRWPQFQLLLNDVAALSIATKPETTVLSLERNVLYGGRSLFAPLFRHAKYSAIDLSPKANLSRGAYNSGLLDEIVSEFGEPFFDFVAIDEVEIHGLRPDLVIVPNVLHHIGRPWDFFERIASMGPKKIYLFDSTLREWHQIPDDYYRMTPFAIEQLMSAYGYTVTSIRTTGGPFSAILYCWEQALEYLEADEAIHAKYSDWLKGIHRAELMSMEQRFTLNIARPNSAFPTAFSVVLEKLPQR